MVKINCSKTAFSLIELSLVLLVLSLIVSGLISTIVTNSSNSKVTSSYNSVNKIYQALTTYLAVNKKLPCPASLKVEISSVNYAIQDSAAGFCDSQAGIYTINSDIIYGMAPVVTLGLNKEDSKDAYGNKIIYVVLKSFTQDNPDLSSLNGNIILNNLVNNVAYSDENNIVLLVISHGLNKYGAFSYGINVQNDFDLASNFERGNIITNLNDSNKTAVIANSSNFSKYASGQNSFDDILLYKNKETLLNDAASLALGQSDFFTKATQ